MAQYALQAKGISFTRGEREILRDLQFSVPQGQFIGLLGPNGTGKSTLLKVLAGLLKVKQGSILLGDTALHKIATRDIAKRITYMPQTTVVDYQFTVEQIVMMGRHPHIKRWQVASEADRELVEEAMQMTGITAFRERFVNTLSGGERQLVFLARAIAQATDILLLDEPTSDLDIYHQVQICEIITRLTAQGKTVLAAIHDLNLAAQYCDKLMLLYEGDVVVYDDVAQVLTEQNLITAFKTDTYIYRDPHLAKLQVLPYALHKK